VQKKQQKNRTKIFFNPPEKFERFNESDGGIPEVEMGIMFTEWLRTLSDQEKVFILLRRYPHYSYSRIEFCCEVNHGKLVNIMNKLKEDFLNFFEIKLTKIKF